MRCLLEKTERQSAALPRGVSPNPRAPCARRVGFAILRADEGRKAGATETRRKFFALSDGDSFPSLSIIQNGMGAKTISIFVDES